MQERKNGDSAVADTNELVISRNILINKRKKQMSNTQSYEAMEASYSSDTFQRSAPIKSSKQRKPMHGRRGKAPQSVNGIHRRRKRKMAW